MRGPALRGGIVVTSLVMVGGAAQLHAQDLAPRAYVITPLGSNALTLSNAYNDGDLLLEGAVPVEDATGRLYAPSVTYYRAFGLLGRSRGSAQGNRSRARRRRRAIRAPQRSETSDIREESSPRTRCS